MSTHQAHAEDDPANDQPAEDEPARDGPSKIKPASDGVEQPSSMEVDAMTDKSKPQTRPRRYNQESTAPIRPQQAAFGRARRGGPSDHAPKPPAPDILEHNAPQEQSKPEPVMPGAGPKNPLLGGSRYAITVYRWKVEDGTQEAMGSILSQSLRKVLSTPSSDAYAGGVSLAQMRKITPGMQSLDHVASVRDVQ